MLILTRRIGESIIIGDDIVITLLSMKGGQSKIGIKAPNKLSVHREEVFKLVKQKIEEENK